MKPAPTLADLKAEVRRGTAVESEIRAPGYHVHGLCLPDGSVVVNPRPAYVETALHELLHRMRPRWGEARVRKESERLLSEMSDTDVSWFYRTYRKRAIHRRTPITVEAD